VYHPYRIYSWVFSVLVLSGQFWYCPDMADIGERRNVKVDLRVASGELEVWRATAKVRGTSLSGMIREAVNHWLSEPPSDAEVAALVLPRGPVVARYVARPDKSFKPDFGSRLKGGDGA
jgi:hypothetical protein